MRKGEMMKTTSFEMAFIIRDFMVKKGMARPDWTHTQPRNDVSPVPELQGKAKSGKERAKPIIAPAPDPT